MASHSLTVQVICHELLVACDLISSAPVRKSNPSTAVQLLQPCFSVAKQRAGAASPIALMSQIRCLLHRSGLQTLHIKGAAHLQEEALSMLAPLAGTLQELSLQGCHALRDRAGQHLQALTRLTRLDVGGLRPLSLLFLDSCLP